MEGQIALGKTFNLEDDVDEDAPDIHVTADLLHLVAAGGFQIYGLRLKEEWNKFGNLCTERQLPYVGGQDDDGELHEGHRPDGQDAQTENLVGVHSLVL